jgi:hypothetical protein
MDKASKSDTTSDGTTARRKRMQSQARSLRPTRSPEADGFQTPDWLDRSFVLPLTRPEVTDVPNQSVPDHDNYSEPRLQESPAREPQPAVPTAQPTAEPTPAFVRPPSRDVDFARVIKRADRCRTATRTAAAATALACLALIGFLLTNSPVLLSVTVLGAAGALGALVVRLSLSSAAIPHVKR